MSLSVESKRFIEFSRRFRKIADVDSIHEVKTALHELTKVVFNDPNVYREHQYEYVTLLNDVIKDNTKSFKRSVSDVTDIFLRLDNWSNIDKQLCMLEKIVDEIDVYTPEYMRKSHWAIAARSSDDCCVVKSDTYQHFKRFHENKYNLVKTLFFGKIAKNAINEADGISYSSVIWTTDYLSDTFQPSSEEYLLVFKSVDVSMNNIRSNWQGSMSKSFLTSDIYKLLSYIITPDDIIYDRKEMTI